MILRKAKHLEKGNVIIVSHPRYATVEFEITYIEFQSDGDGHYIKVDTRASDLTYGPTIVFKRSDMVNVTPE
jgi:hypothetical protein